MKYTKDELSQMSQEELVEVAHAAVQMVKRTDDYKCQLNMFATEKAIAALKTRDNSLSIAEVTAAAKELFNSIYVEA